MTSRKQSVFLVLLCAVGAANAADGDIDTSFGADGIATTGITDQYSLISGRPVVQSDGKIVICGTKQLNGSSGADILVARFNANGTLDTSFNFNGLVTIDFDDGGGGADGDVGKAVAVQSDGKIVVAGTTHGAAAGSRNFAIARLNADGSLDTTFGAGTGKATVAFDLNGGSGDDEASAIALQADGKILVAGSAQTSVDTTQFAVARLLGDGTRDSSFNLNGKVAFGFSVPGATDERDAALYVAADASGRVLLGGSVNYKNASSQTVGEFAAARLSSNGHLDANFHANGMTTIAIDPGNGISSASVAGGLLQRDGKLVLLGNANSSTSADANFDVAIVRVLPNGSLDSNFGFGGKVLVAFDLVANGPEAAYGAVEQGNGKLVVAGAALGPTVGSYSSELGIAMRLDADGSLDENFGAFGKQTYDLGLGVQQAFVGVALQGTQIIASGISYVPSGGADPGIDNVVVRLTNDLIFADDFE